MGEAASREAAIVVIRDLVLLAAIGLLWQAHLLLALADRLVGDEDADLEAKQTARDADEMVRSLPVSD